MSDVRIERVEPCDKCGTAGVVSCQSFPCPCGGHDCGRCNGSGFSRKVLDGFPPEAVEAAAEAIAVLTERAGQGATLTTHSIAEAALSAAWRALTGEADK